MTQVVEIIGVGPVEFPDGMSKEEMAAALKKLPMPKGASSVTVEPAPPEPFKPVPEQNPVWQSTGGGAAMGRPRVMNRTNVQAEPRPTEAALAGFTKGAVINPVLGATQLLSGGTVGNEAIQKYRNEAEPYKQVSPEAFIGGEIAGSIAPTARIGSAIGQIPSMARLAPAATQAVANVAPKIAPIVAPVMGGAGYGAASSVMTPDESGAIGNQALANRVRNLGIDTTIGAAVPAAIPAIKTAGKATGKVLAELLGLPTGVGGEVINEAAKAGVKGNQQFLQNMRGEVPATDILEAAQSGMQTLKANRKQAFEKGFQTTKNNQIFLDFKPIETKFNDVVEGLKVKGLGGEEASKVGKETLNDVREIKSILDEWKNKRSLHTAEGLDALKRRIDDVWRNDMTNESKSILTQTRQVIKNTIVKQDKNYAKTMRDYEQALGVERELERALSLGKKSSIDTAIRKLQSLTRNNANTSYNYRKELANVLRDEAGVDLMPALAGQALNTWTPRGIQKFVPTLTAGAGAANPALWATLPLQSPRMVGEMAYGAGRAAAPMINLANSTKLTDKQRMLAQLLTMKAAQQGASNE